MKTNKIKIFFSIISFCFLVTSCNNLLSELTQQKSYIQISTNLDNSNQRTVLPNFSVVLGQGYTWELYKDGILFQTWNDDNGKSAYQNMCESKIEVDPGSYSFELMVKKEGEIILKSESQTVTIEQNKKIELNFVLCPPTDNEAYGSVNFILKFPKEKVNIVKAYLFEPGDEKKEPVGNMQEVVISKTDSSSTANITVNNVPAGSYLLKVDLFYQVADYSRSETINTYTTIVQVAAGFCSEAEVTLNSLTDYYTITYMVDDQEITTFQGGDNPQTTFKKNSEVGLLIACKNTNNQISIGWFYDPECMRPVELNTDGKFTITENITLYSQWGSKVSNEVLGFGAIDTENNIEGFLIQNETGLNYFRNIVNGTLTENIIVRDNVVYRKGTPYPTVNAKLCDDIVLSNGSDWVPIGNGKYEGTTNNIYYEGSFDGNGKGVTNLNINSDDETDLGFFGCVQDATIKNLYVQGNISATKDSTRYAVGGIVGYAKSLDESVTISNCINNVEINSQSTFVGGILGNFYSGSGEINIDSCVNIANLTAPYPSGILTTTGNSKIKNCLNLGNLNSTSTSSNYSAGICMTYSVNCNVSNCINTGKITLSYALNNSVYPIQRYTGNSQGSPTCSECYYDSNILPTVNDVENVDGKTSSDLDTLNFQGWYNNTAPDSKYPIPSTIQEALENKSSCWGIIFEAANIEASSGYVPGAYYVNETGNDTNDGSSIDKPYQKLTKAITNAIASDAKTVYVNGTLTPSNQGITDPSSGEHEQYSVFYIQDNAFDDVVEIIGVSENTNFSGNNETRIFSTKQACNFKMKNINFMNGRTDGSGAAIYFWQGSLELDSCKISGNSSTLGNAYNGIYNYGGSVLKMTNTTCENSVYLSNTTATIGSNCTIGTASSEATDGFITLDDSTLKLDGENIFIYKPIYVKSLSSSIQIGDYYSHGKQITIKLASGITDLIKNGTVYTLIPNCDATMFTYFNIECEDPEIEATLGADGNITVN